MVKLCHLGVSFAISFLKDTYFRVAVEYPHELDHGVIMDVIRSMCESYPNLKTNVCHSGDNVQLKVIEDLDINDILEVVNDESKTIQQLMLDIQNRSFQYFNNMPLWKLVLLNGTNLVFYADHLVFDGISGINFHKRFIDALKEKPQLVNNNVYPTPNSLISGYNVPFKSMLYIIALSLAPKYVSNWAHYLLDPYKDLSYREYPIPKKNIEQLKVLSFTKSTTDKLLTKCRDNNVKLTSLLVHVGLLAATRVTKDFDTETSIPINNRPQIHKPKDMETFDDSFGLFMGHVDIKLPSMNKLNNDPNDFNWGVTKRIHKYIHDNIKSSCYDLEALKLVNPKEMIEGQQEKQFTTTLEVSNLGYIDVNDVLFDQQVLSTLFGINVASGLKGLNIGLRTRRKEWLNDFYSDMKTILESLVTIDQD